MDSQTKVNNCQVKIASFTMKWRSILIGFTLFLVLVILKK